MNAIRTAAVLLGISVFAALAPAQTTFTYQGSLADAGSPATGTYVMKFSLWNALAGGAQVGSTIDIPSQAVDLGLFTSELDFGSSITITGPLWLEISVDGDTLVPRQSLTSAPFSIQTRGIAVDATDNVGIGHDTPLFPLHVRTPVATTAILGEQTSPTGAVWGVQGTSASDGGVGVSGIASNTGGNALGGYFSSESSGGGGVEGVSSSTTGFTYGVRGRTDSSSGTGVAGTATAATGFTHGLTGFSASQNGRGVYGEASAPNGSTTGGWFLSRSSSGFGAFAHASSATGITQGLFGRSDSTSGTGVAGTATAATGLTTGVIGTTLSTDGRGVFAWANSPTGTNYGVYAKTSSLDGYAGYFEGGRNYFAGDVGIGTNTPAYPLDVVTNGSRVVSVRNLSTSSASDGLWSQTASGNGWGVFGFASAASGSTNGIRGQVLSTSGTGALGLANAPTGTAIGVSGQADSPDGTGVLGLHANSSGTGAGVLGYTNSTSTGALGVHGRINSTSPGAFSAAVRGENRGTSFGGIGVYGSHNGGGWGLYGISITGRGVYGTASASTGVNYAVYGSSNSTSGYDFYAAGAGINYGASSSIRWKHNVTNIDSPLDKLAALRGVYFDWDEEHGGGHDVGMIAEEVGKVLPEIVAYEEDGEYAHGMDYSKLTPLLVEALNTLRAEKDAEIASLCDRNDALQSRLANLEQLVNHLASLQQEPKK